MMDLDHDLLDELQHFTEEVRHELSLRWGPCVIGEHGRIAACISHAVQRHEPHCLHAHQLVFPGQATLSLRSLVPSATISEFSSFSEARCEFQWPGQYLYVQTADGRCQLAEINGPLPRQFLRAAVALQRGCPELADWRSSPRRHKVDAAAELLRVPAPA